MNDDFILSRAVANAAGFTEQSSAARFLDNRFRTGGPRSFQLGSPRPKDNSLDGMYRSAKDRRYHGWKT